jgi:hypothetical protein
MKTPVQRPTRHEDEEPATPLAPGPVDRVQFIRYTQRVWSKLAGRPISSDEAEQIVEDFDRLLRALDHQEGGGQ